MVSSPVPAPLDDPADPNHASSLDTREPEGIRRTNSPHEAYIKAVGRINYFYALLFGLEAAYFSHFAYLHLTGAISADWTVRPGWVVFIAACWLTAVLAFIAGYGFRRLKRWALGIEVLFAAGALYLWVSRISITSERPDLAGLAAGLALMTALFAPLLNLWDVRRSTVFTTDYRRVMTATPGVRVKARLPWALKLPAVLLVVLYVAISVIREASAGGKL